MKMEASRDLKGHSRTWKQQSPLHPVTNNTFIAMSSKASRRLHAKLGSSKRFCSYSQTVYIKGRRGNHKRQSSSSLFLTPPPIWLVCSCHLGMLQSHPSSSLVLLFQDPWVVQGDAFTEGVLFIDFLGKLILIANTWGPFLKHTPPPPNPLQQESRPAIFLHSGRLGFFPGVLE